MNTRRRATTVMLGLVAFAGLPRFCFTDIPTAQPEDCATTPVEDLLPGVMAPLAGEAPIWVVDGSFGSWLGPEEAVKTAWVVERDLRKDVLVEGHRLGTGERVRFMQPDRTMGKSLRLEFTERLTIIPGGATDEQVRRFAFFSSLAYYPVPGCWELIASAGEDTVRIVLDLAAP